MSKTYPRAGATEVSARPDFPASEATVLAYWKADRTFQASIDAREPGENGSNEFVFYDGPPFANGLPHYGHLLTGYAKDVVPRYQTMKGRRVERRFGWDTHGLPAELEAERQLGIKGRGDVLDLGIEKFNDACRQSVMRYAGEWQEYVTKQARWVDFEHDYKTLDPSYMESVLWAFKTLYDKGYVYEGQRVLPYCWVDETPLSSHELKMDDDVYQSRQDPSVTVWVRLQTGERLLAWTTTPWTLPSNLAMAVGPDLDYVVVEFDDERYILAEARLDAYRRELGEDAVVVDRLKGSEIIGRTYEPLFDFLADFDRFGTQAAFRVIAADHVTTEDGTGVVHMAPAYGEEDQLACTAAGIPTILTVDDRARFTSIVPPFEGMQVFDANPFVIDALKESGHLVRRETYEHSYPHCWRCRNPLIYKAVSSWFVEVTKFRDRMVELNQEITWTPSHIKDGQFGNWLANARDWSISRNRFWGSPIPVWKSDDPNYPRIDVYGSIAELEADFGTTVTDLHRPYIDDLIRQNPDDPTGRSMMRRVTDVLDVWFDSGSMPYAQVHYPFENKEWFEGLDGAMTGHFPGDFIVEYIGQTRGWFYLMHVLATALFDRPAFKTCISHGIVLGDDGRKMSKSLQNYPDVNEVFARDGSDAMRWFLMSSPILRGGNLIVTEPGIREGVRQAVLPLWNAYYFLTLYAGAAEKTGRIRTDSSDVLDRYILAKTSTLVAEVTAQMDVYDIAGACASVRSFLEVLTNWYVRRSRQRFWDGDDDAIDTLHTVLETFCRVAAPLLPLTTEAVWRGLTGERSVHLTDWPDPTVMPTDDELVAAMDEAREVASVALSLRKGAKLRVRQPLAALTVASPAFERLQQFGALLADEVNVRNVSVTPVEAGEDHRVERKLAVNARAAGPRLGKQVQQVIGAAKKGDWSVTDGVVTVGGVDLIEGEYTLDLVASGSGTDVIGMLRSGGFVSLDTVLDNELLAQGSVNDLLRLVQQARKDAGFQVSDRITLALAVDDDLWAAVEHRREQIMAETLATAIGRVPEIVSDRAVAGEVGDGVKLTLAVALASA
ncbi:Isoleucyl-tRNA synthetase [Nakamurella panacisegetis]|uniref:Isoleucine--tRNA ligase n=1 Tax=Nakamurella panacisegetis TaxID=1090615 RepID=A0A1H0QAV1_9ACTN|nr:isoleucine--tRNA ligase [Nakamurella panacisegetis]SDP14195.1 Isoleucyl-tRNA synthetase [Nakamurella panacisegetis]